MHSWFGINPVYPASHATPQSAGIIGDEVGNGVGALLGLLVAVDGADEVVGLFVE